MQLEAVDGETSRLRLRLRGNVRFPLNLVGRVVGGTADYITFAIMVAGLRERLADGAPR